jgi:two-component system KDP operon response regulator KdpE
MKQPVNILIIDPEPENRKGLSEILTSQGFEILEAVTGTDGLGKAATYLPDIIILEPELSDMDGVGLTEKIRKWSELPILMLSKRREEREIVRALDSGADDYLIKPFYPEELLARIRVALRRIEWRFSPWS